MAINEDPHNALSLPSSLEGRTQNQVQSQHVDEDGEAAPKHQAFSGSTGLNGAGNQMDGELSKDQLTPQEDMDIDYDNEMGMADDEKDEQNYMH